MSCKNDLTDSDVLQKQIFNPDNLKKNEERKAVEDSDHKLTEELFSNNPNIINEKNNTSFINEKVNLSNNKNKNKNKKLNLEQTEKTKQIIICNTILKKKTKQQDTHDDIFASIYDKYCDIEDKFLR